MKCNINIPAPCPFCGRELLQKVSSYAVEDLDGRIAGRIEHPYWKHPDAKDCPLGFGLVLENDADIIRQWNRRKK